MCLTAAVGWLWLLSNWAWLLPEGHGDEIVVRAAAPPKESDVSEVRLDRQMAEGRSAADSLDELPGVTVRRSGGLGQVTFMLIRGASPNQVPMYIEGAPLTGGNTTAIDLSTLPFSPSGRLTVYRGTAPMELDLSGMGGAVLMTIRPVPETLWASGRAGSFGTGLGNFEISGKSLFISGSYSSSAATYEYYDDNGTYYTTSDDSIRTRRNAQSRSGHILTQWHGDGWRVTAFHTSVDAGVPGPVPLTTTRTHRNVNRTMIIASGRSKAGTVNLHTGRYLEHYRDPLAELGLGYQDDVNDTYSAGLRWHASHVTAGRLRLKGALSWEWTRFRPYRTYDSAWKQPPMASRNDFESAAGLSVPFGRHVLSAHWRGAVLSSGHSLRRASVYRFTLSGTVKRFFYRIHGGTERRFPSFFELYGDHGVLRGSVDLADEEGWGAGASVRRRMKLPYSVRALAQVSVFHRDVNNLIQFVPVSQMVAVAMNIGHARVDGLEARAALRRRSWHIEGNYTFMKAVNLSSVPWQNGKPLPGRPEHSVNIMVRRKWRFETWTGTLVYRLNYESGMYLDASGRRPLPDRILHSASAMLESPARDMLISLSVSNLTNLMKEDVRIVPAPASPPYTHPQPLVNYIGYPLPGLSVYLTVTVKRPVSWHDSGRTQTRTYTDALGIRHSVTRKGGKGR